MTRSAALRARARAASSLRSASGSGDHGQIAARGQALADLQTRGADRAVDEDLGRHLPVRFRGLS